MRRGVWVVLGLVGMAPVGALAQQRQVGTVTDESMDDTDRPIIVEMPARGERRGGNQTAGRARVSRPNPGRGTGGSGANASPQVWSGAPNRGILQGTLRAVTGDRLRMADGTGRVYEFGLGNQTRIIGRRGGPVAAGAARGDAGADRDPAG